ncbi:hypothetical protein FisN_4Hh466 [Fistulifera solaris]|uniref:Uncharacterized protein n=1 Tax=Fistulifera solaris TaxID=1519565 RepID=A0A1Z5KIS8_FISSO|nr:hypothetical protein FisN_4Hh466 [Fistulifera solaris]|eukprot:GAX26035.1 hypothetical protein FisN_4Hh466 [Fistulifera solaris]
MGKTNGLPIIVALSFLLHTTTAWSLNIVHISHPRVATCSRTSLWVVPGADIEQPPVENFDSSTLQESTDPSAGDIPLLVSRGKVNEIDFCIAPADVSLSRAYGTTTSQTTTAQPTLSLTRALNNASNRAVRRIILARSWPSAEALNLSLRQVAKVEKEREEAAQMATKSTNGEADDSNTARCPVPRPILNVLTRRRKDKQDKAKTTDDKETPIPRSRTDTEYIHDQIKNFKERYGKLPGYSVAQDYLEAILCLATSGVESTTVANVLQDGVYDEAYKRVIAVLNSVGIVFEVDPETKRQKIASKIIDQDICLSMIDKIQLRNPVPDPVVANTLSSENTASEEDYQITKEDLGGVLLSAKEPSMTRQLNSLANIVERALLFGGDQELLVLAETLDADRAAFVDRWYPDTGGLDEDKPWDAERRPGVQFLNCLVHLLRDCYTNGVVTTLDPPFALANSYANAYERLVASVVELGSGYLKPVPSDILALPKPRTAQEELGRFAVWETTFRQRQDPDVLINNNPSDLVGTWEVRDVIAGETIGTTSVKLLESGSVQVKEPLEGLTWRLDPGPTHLDTCTFQVLSSDGTVLQYRGFLDRGARLEARFSKRPIRIRGSVQFQMRDGSIDYYKDILPINYKSGTTKFIMTKIDGEQ